MADNARQTCSECGAVLSEPSNTVPLRCESCMTASQTSPVLADKTPDEQSRQTANLAASKRTVILGSHGDTDASQMPTLDFVPSADPTEPTAFASDERVAKQVQVGRFRVISILGRGAFGTVYRAYDPLLDREVALKVPRFAADDRDMLERFHREAKAAARLHHPNIVTLYENGQTDEGPYLVAEFINGVPLSQKLRESRPDLRMAVDWARQIAEGLYYAHTEGVVHRDVKPANIMLNLSGRPQVMDFGLAKRSGDIESGMTMEGQIVGTPNYMSPEQARGAIGEIGPHSDQYSVGVVLYEMLCGRPPFAGNPWTIIARVANVRQLPPTPRSLKPDLPRDLEACCLKAMEKDPQLRYPTLQAMADDLDHWLKGLPLLARPIGPMERLARWCRHNRMIASLGGTIAAMVVVALIVGYVLAYRFRDLADVAKRDANEAKVARDDEKTARLATERSIIDSYTEAGLTAHRNGDPREAILWFANAVAAAENHPSRERHNRIRLQSWLSQVATPVQAFNPPAGWKKGLSYHPAGRWLLSLAVNGVGELLQISDGQRLPLPMNGSIHAATFSPDGKLLVLASGPEVVVLGFDVEHPVLGVPTTKRELDRWTHPDKVNDLQFSGDGQLLVVGGDNSVQVRDMTQKSFRTKPMVIGSQVLAAAITPDGRRYAVRSADQPDDANQKVSVFSCSPDSTDSEPLLPVQSAKCIGKVPPLFVGNNRLVVSEDNDAVRCWDIDRKEIVWSFKSTRVLALMLSPDGKWIAVGQDAEVVLLDAVTGEPAEQRIKHTNMIHNLSFHPTRPLLLTGCVDHTAHLFEIPSGKPVGPPIPHSDAVHRCVWSPDGASFATVHWSGDLVRVWKSSDQQQEVTLTANSASGPFVRIDSLGNRWLPSGFENWRDRTELEVVDWKTGKAIGPKLSGPGLISDADFIPKSPLVVLVGGSSREDVRRGLTAQKLDGPGFIRFVNSETGTPAFEDVPTPSQPIAVRTSPDGQTVVVLCYQGHLLLLESATGKPRAEHLAFAGQSAVFGFLIRDRIRFSNRGDQFVLWGCNSLAELRKTDTGERVAGIPHDSGFVHDAQFSPDGKLVATCSSDHTVRLWDSATGLAAGAPLAHAGWVFSAQFSQDSRRLLTASSDKQARIWDLGTRTAILATREQSDQVFSVTFLAGEEHFLTSTRDGQIAAYDSSLGKLIAPARRMPGKVFQLSRHVGSSRVIASGDVQPIRRFDADQWILQPDMRLSRDDVRLLGEILASQRIHTGGAATSLTSAEWIDRWKTLRKKHPDGSALQTSAPKSHTAD